MKNLLPTLVAIALVLGANPGRAEPPGPLPARTLLHLPLLLRAGFAWPVPAQAPAAGVSILPNHSVFVSRTGALHIAGEVLNNTPDNVDQIKVTASLLDAEGSLLETDYAYTFSATLMAGDRTCFDVVLSPPPGWASYRLETPEYWRGAEPWPRLSVLGDTGAYNHYGFYVVTGQVRNDSPTRLEWVRTVATFYTGEGRVAGCAIAPLAAFRLGPGAAAFFEIDEHYRTDRAVRAHRLQVDGEPR